MDEEGNEIFVKLRRIADFREMNKTVTLTDKIRIISHIGITSLIQMIMSDEL